MIKTKIIGINLNTKQLSLFHEITNNLRHVWNKAIELQMYVYKETGGYIQYRDLEYFMVHELEYDYIKNAKSQSREHLLMNLDDAYKRFFKGISRYPRFKSYRNPVRSIYLHNQHGNSIQIIKSNSIKVPYFGEIETRTILHDMDIISGRLVIKLNKKIYLQLLINDHEVEEQPSFMTTPIGIDIGVKKLVTFSRPIVDTSNTTCKRFTQEFPKLSTINNHIFHYENRIRRLQRSQNKKYAVHEEMYREEKLELIKMKGELDEKEYNRRLHLIWLKTYHTKNIDNLQRKINICYQHIADIRKDYERKIIKSIINNSPEYIVIEDIDIGKMIKESKSKYIRRAILNSRWYSFREWLTRKCNEYGIELRIADRKFKSTQICSHCGHIHELSITDRTYECPKCGYIEDRDINAAINLVNTNEYRVA